MTRARNKSKVIQEEKIIERGDIKDTDDIEIPENPPIVRSEGEEENHEEKEEGRNMAGESIETTKLDDAEMSKVETLTSDEEGETEGVWDLVRVIPATEKKVKCRHDDCSNRAVAVWATDTHPEDEWPLCEEHQLEEFGGWPEGVEPVEASSDIVDVEMRSIATKDEHPISESAETISTSSVATEIIATPPTKNRMNLSNEENGLVVGSTTNEVDVIDGERDPNPSEEKFDLSGIVPLKKLLSNPIKCSDEACLLPACSIWTSTSDPKKWYYCIDCQERDFGGWPPSNELPRDLLHPEYLRAIASKCSRKKKPKLPIVISNCVTPPPNHSVSRTTGSLGKKLEQWTAEAKKSGADGIIVKTNEAKKVVYEALYDAFRPMNVNDTYMLLKKQVPPPILKNTLEEMSMDWQEDDLSEASNDDDCLKMKCLAKKSRVDEKEAFVGSLCFKAGKSVTSSLYYVDYNKIKEMSSEERGELAGRLANTKAEHDHMVLTLKQVDTKTAQLLLEPTNDKLIELLNNLEKNVAILTEKVHDAKALTINEPQKKKLKRQIQHMAGQYRKRKRLCCSFLSSLEEISDGTISKKKCLKGDGQIALDSDESANEAMIAYVRSKKRSKKNKASLADENFVGVTLDSQQMVKRVYIKDE